MSSIIIESSPVSISGNCYANFGDRITFTIVSGITSASTIFEWFLNGYSVYFGTSYTLYSASSNDEVYVKVVECSNTIKLRIGNWIEDNIFYYNDIVAGSTQTYNIDMNATFSYKILSIVLQCSNTMSDVELRINNIPVIWKDSANTGTTIDVTSGIIDINAYDSNTVLDGDDVTLVTSSTGNSILLQGKIRFLRYTKLSPVPPTTTTTTTISPVTTTTTSTSPVTTTTTTTLSCSEYCFLGFYSEGDPIHPNGGTVVYIDCLGYTQSETFIFVDAGIISITAHSIISNIGCSPQTCPTTTTTSTTSSTTTTTLAPVTTTTTTAVPSVSTVFIHIPN